MIRTFIWPSAAVGRLKALNTFKTLILMYRIFKRSICLMNIRSFKDNRSWILLFSKISAIKNFKFKVITKALIALIV